MFKKGIVAVIILSIFVSLSACGDKETISQDPVTTSPSTVIQESTIEETTKQEESTTAVEETKDNSQNSDFAFPVEGQRPYAVMIDNEGSRPLPQGGLYMAQVVYEIIVEGGATRLMPVFWGVKPEMIGPVRSSRHYFIDYAMEHDAIYVHFGYSPKALHDLKAFKINNINGVGNGGEVFWDLTKDRKNWQDSYTDMEKVEGYVARVKYRTTTEKRLVFTYNMQDTELSDGLKAEKINIKYNRYYSSSYTYDSMTKTYMRFRKGSPHMERITDKQLSAKNIIIQNVKNNTIKGDKLDRQEVYDVGNGGGWYITCGKAIKIKWSKESRISPTKYTDESGTPIMLNPGQTWVQIVPWTGNVDIE